MEGEGLNEKNGGCMIKSEEGKVGGGRGLSEFV
jgi:hypothetical protein